RAAAAPALRPADTSPAGAPPLRRRHLGLALPAGLRPGPALQRLALPAACVLHRRGAAVLVSRGAASPRPAALVVVGPVPAPDPGRPGEHRPGGGADVLRPRALSVLRGGAAPRRSLAPGRPVGGRRPHVGPGLPGIPAAAVRAGGATAVRRRADKG